LNDRLVGHIAIHYMAVCLTNMRYMSMQRRSLGGTGESLSIVGFGGIIVKDETPADAERYVAEAIDRGVDYFDIAPGYGNAEEKLGPALEPYRDDVFLACKTHERSKKGADADLERSLTRLRTDHVDLYQLHGVVTAEDVETILAPGGAIETFVEARDQGKARFLGFSAHSEEAAATLIERFEFDTVLFPVNWVCWHQGGFGPKLVELANAKGLGLLALKSLAQRALRENEDKPWPKCWYKPVDTADEAEMAFRFTMSRPITAAVSPSHIELFRWACNAADKFTPLTEEEEKHVAQQSQGFEPIFPESVAS
jgi:aryl-alcohol dehydrogenase-like predicted oxidoreductase